MDVIWFLIPLSIVLVVIALRAFIWAIRSRQFEDLDKEASRILFDDDRPTERDRHD